MENVDLETQEYGNDLKVILVGNVSTGKTSIVDRYINNTFRVKIKATISPNFQYKLIKKNGIIYRLHFWDIPGQDRNPTLTSVFCRDAQGFVFCCDALVEKSRNDILVWKKSLQDFLDISNIPLIIMENKCDLLGKEEEDYNKDIDKLKQFCEENNFSGAFRTSALNGYNIENAMNFLVDEIITALKVEEENNINKNSEENESKIKPMKLTDKNEKNKRCC